jgi:hypothetical protein
MPTETCAWEYAAGTANTANNAKYLKYFIARPPSQNHPTSADLNTYPAYIDRNPDREQKLLTGKCKGMHSYFCAKPNSKCNPLIAKWLPAF